MIESSETSRHVGLHSLVQALVARDFDELQRHFCDVTQFRALIPPGLREASNAGDAATYFKRWFGDCDVIEPLDVRADAIGDRESVQYRLKLRENGAWYLCEQQIYANIGADGIERMDLLCSGFRPIDEKMPA